MPQQPRPQTLEDDLALTAKPASDVTRKQRWTSFLFHRSRLYMTLYLLMMPTIISMAVFGYYPKLDVIVKAFYRWEPGYVEEYIGLNNFIQAFNDPIFWQSFKVIAILLAANLIKMIPAVVVAIALHRLISSKWRYFYQVIFVIPMVIPHLVVLLIWKSFYDPDYGILNRFLNLTGIMNLLAWLDGTEASPGVMPTIASFLSPVISGVRPVFGSVWGLMLLGAMILTAMGDPEHKLSRWRGHVCVLIASVVTLFTSPLITLLPGIAGVVVFLGIIVVVMVAMSKAMGPHWIIWPFWMLAGVWAYHGNLLLLPVMIGVSMGFAEIVRLTFDRLNAQDVLRWTGGVMLAIGAVLVLFGMIWTSPIEQFGHGHPAWLSNKSLVLPAIIFWGFPWVGTVGVLIYLAGLQQISQDVYEAADLDGVGPIGMLFRIELPLIMTQVRINLIFMTIGTLTGYEFFLILLGPGGGPGGVGIVPGLYMFTVAFEQGRFGYACTLGMILFFMILLLTIVYQKYVKVEK